VLHQGTVYPVTPVVVRVIAGLLGDSSLRTALPMDDDTKRATAGQLFDQTPDATPVLVPVLGFLAEVGESLAWAWPALPDPLPQASPTDLDMLYAHLADDDDESAWESPVLDILMCQAVVELRAMASDVAVAITPVVNDMDQKIRCLAAHATVQWCRTLDSHATWDASNVVVARLSIAQERPEQASLVVSAGQLGVDVSGFLNETDEAVRCCAALFVHTDEATGILIDALTCPDRSTTGSR
jgi:hypothetical protein